MSRLLASFALVASVGVLAPAADARVHRLHRPPPPLQAATSVDEDEYLVRPSRTRLRSGPVRIGVVNRGMDDHDLAIADASGAVLGVVALAPGARGTLTPTLAPGRYKLYCSLFAGTPIAHEALGMFAFLDVV